MASTRGAMHHSRPPNPQHHYSEAQIQTRISDTTLSGTKGVVNGTREAGKRAPGNDGDNQPSLGLSSKGKLAKKCIPKSHIKLRYEITSPFI